SSTIGSMKLRHESLRGLGWLNRILSAVICASLGSGPSGSNFRISHSDWLIWLLRTLIAARIHSLRSAQALYLGAWGLPTRPRSAMDPMWEVTAADAADSGAGAVRSRLTKSATRPMHHLLSVLATASS